MYPNRGDAGEAMEEARLEHSETVTTMAPHSGKNWWRMMSHELCSVAGLRRNSGRVRKGQ